ncbi:hypothetical protein ACWIVU_09410 [Ursidibacter arcticus]
MATFRKRGDKWRAEIVKNGIRKSQRFPQKQKQVVGLCLLKVKLRQGEYSPVPKMTFAELIDKYVEVTVNKGGARSESLH